MPPITCEVKSGASEGIRTLDIHVGNVTLYQTELRSLPDKPKDYDTSPRLQADIRAAQATVVLYKSGKLAADRATGLRVNSGSGFRTDYFGYPR